MTALKITDLIRAVDTNFEIVESRSKCQIKYVCAVNSTDSVNLRGTLEGRKGLNVKFLMTEYLQAAYMEYEGETALVISARDGKIVHNPDIFNESIVIEVDNQVRKEGKKIGDRILFEYNHDTFCSIYVAFVWAVAMSNSCGLEETIAIQAKNSFKNVKNNFELLARGKAFLAAKHLEYFSWIYYVELKFIGEIFGENSQVKIHDVATNTAHLPLLINYLSDDPIFGVQYTGIACSDLEVEHSRRNIEAILSDSPNVKNKIDLYKLDLTEDNKILEEADVIVANDILEHFPENMSFDVLNKLWSRTKNVLLIHVPFEDEPTVAWGHQTTFNKKKLMDWAAKLDECENVTEQYAYVASESFDSFFIDNCMFLRRNQAVA